MVGIGFFAGVLRMRLSASGNKSLKECERILPRICEALRPGRYPAMVSQLFLNFK